MYNCLARLPENKAPLQYYAKTEIAVVKFYSESGKQLFEKQIPLVKVPEIHSIEPPYLILDER